jgi:hypothetical protein
MKNKKLLYVLLPLVVVIWGCIIYKIYIQVNHKTSYAYSGNGLSRMPVSGAITDSFTLTEGYRDPFLQGVTFSVPEEEGIEEDLLSNRTQLKNTVVFPDLKYYGVVSNSVQKKQKTGLLKIAGKDFILKEGSSEQKIKVLHLYNDSAEVLYYKTKKTIIKK